MWHTLIIGLPGPGAESGPEDLTLATWSGSEAVSGSNSPSNGGIAALAKAFVRPSLPGASASDLPSWWPPSRMQVMALSRWRGHCCHGAGDCCDGAPSSKSQLNWEVLIDQHDLVATGGVTDGTTVARIFLACPGGTLLP